MDHQTLLARQHQSLMNDKMKSLVILPIEQAYPLELSTGAATLFFGRLGSNTVWDSHRQKASPAWQSPTVVAGRPW